MLTISGFNSNGVLVLALAYLAGAVTTGDVSDVLGLAVAVTGFFLGAFRYGAVLLGADKRRIETASAVGFYLGFVTSALVLFYLAVV